MPHKTTEDRASLQLVNDREAIERFEESVLKAVDRHSFPKSARFAIKLALEEAITNGFQHGHKDLPGDTPITVSYEVSGDRLVVVVEDQGPGFTPGDVPDPTLEENISAPSGRGLMLMRAYMSSVRHNAKGNRLELEFRKPDPAAS